MRNAEQRKLTRFEVLEYKGCKCGKCRKVATIETVSNFHFHHIDSSTKEKNISDMLTFSAVVDIKAEADKCVVLCADCHKALHKKKGQTVTRHDTLVFLATHETMDKAYTQYKIERQLGRNSLKAFDSLLLWEEMDVVFDYIFD